MKYLFIILLFFPVVTFAAAPGAGQDWSFGAFFSSVYEFFSDVHDFFFTEVPGLFERAYAYFFEYYILLKIKAMIWSIDFSVGVAKVILSDIGLVSALQNAFDALPQNLYAAFTQLGIPRALNMILEAVITRFVMRFSFIS